MERMQEGLQLVLDGIRPQSMKDMVEWLVEQPMQPRRRQKLCDLGLFDTESHKQLKLV